LAGRQRVVVVGSLNFDLVVESSRLPVAGETVLGGTFRTAAGGKGANQAVAAARVGAQVSMVGCVGQDKYGRELLASLRVDHVDVRRVRRVSEPTGVALIVVAPGGENLIVVAPGANACLSPADIAAAQPLVARANVVVAQLEIPLETVVAAAHAAHQAGAIFMLNAAPARSDLDELLSAVDVLIVNETELASIVGVGSGEEVTAARAVLDRGPRGVVVTLGARGALVVERQIATRVDAFAVDAVDATAAGDAFVGALAARFRGLDSLVDAAYYASAAAGLACTRPGAQPSLPNASEVERLLASVSR
jgi:ribokinase